MDRIVDALKSRDLFRRGRVNVSKLLRLRAVGVVNTVDMITELAREVPKETHPGALTHSASLELGGAPSSLACSGLPCRMSQMDKLARFAALYTDCVYLPNFFSWCDDLRTGADVHTLRYRLLQDLKVLEVVIPLLESGHVKLLELEDTLCLHCAAEAAVGAGTRQRANAIANTLKKRYLDSVQVELTKDGGLLRRITRGPEELIEHGELHSTSPFPPPEVSAMPRFLARLESGKTVPVSNADEEVGSADFSNKVRRSVDFAVLLSHALGTSFITDRSLQIDVLNWYCGSDQVRFRNALLAEHLTAVVPFLQDLTIRNIVRLRKREDEAFVVFRQALNQAIDNCARTDRAFTAGDARALYDDVLHPSLTELDRKVKRAKRDLVRSPVKTALAVAGAMTLGLQAGILPYELAGLASAVGLTKVAAKVLEQGLSISEAKRPAETRQLYFLWKLRQQARKRGRHR